MGTKRDANPMRRFTYCCGKEAQSKGLTEAKCFEQCDKQAACAGVSFTYPGPAQPGAANPNVRSICSTLDICRQTQPSVGSQTWIVSPPPAASWNNGVPRGGSSCCRQ